MVRKKFIERIIDACHVDYYLSASDACRIFWPFRMQPYHEADKRYSRNAEKYVIDSSITEPQITNKDILDKGVELDAEVVLLKDFLEFKNYEISDEQSEEKNQAIKELKENYSDNYEASLDNIREGMKLAERHEYDGEVWIPLQPPHSKMYKQLGSPSKVALGGIKDASPSAKIKHLEMFHNEVGDIETLHCLGFGATEEFITYVSENPDVVDSIDSQTPMSKAINRTNVGKGEEVSTPIGSYLEYRLLTCCRKMSALDETHKSKKDDGRSVFDT